MQKKTLKAETVLELSSQEDFVKMSAMKLDLHLAASSGREPSGESRPPRSTSATVVAKVGSVKVKARGNS